ncbi:hypothetical protein HAX54_033074 [Datura stramonium]|uniref:Ycf2 N-terminal domain-containing protein n=1 Tax=Datura stramonium TaxID=4076 RepID=A0ABS8VBT0_DATST|nr:hypothetical protein [Datura stramonium]
MYRQIFNMIPQRSSFVQVTDSSQLKGSSDHPRDHLDSISNEDSEYHTLINQREIQQRKKDRFFGILPFFKRNEKRDRIRLIPEMPFWIFLNVTAILEREKQMINHLFPEEIEEAEILQIRSFFFSLIDGQNFIWVRIPARDPGCDMVPQDEPDMDSSNKISFLNKNPFLIYFIYSMTGTGEDTRYTTILNPEEISRNMNLFTLSITERIWCIIRDLPFLLIPADWIKTILE